MTKQPNDDYTPEEAARRRDEVIRRMSNTPPQPRTRFPARRPKKGKRAAEDQATREPRGDDKDA